MPRFARVTAPFLLTASLFLTSCATGGPPQRVVDLLGGPEAYALIDAPTGDARVEAYRILPPHLAGEIPVPPDSIELHGHQVLAGPVSVDAESIALLSDVLTSDGTYEWDMAKACEFMPGVAIRYVQGKLEVDVLLCFSCDEWGFLHAGSLRVEDNDDARRALVSLSRVVFPDDEVLRGLK